MNVGLSAFLFSAFASSYVIPDALRRADHLYDVSHEELSYEAKKSGKRDWPLVKRKKWHDKGQRCRPYF